MQGSLVDGGVALHRRVKAPAVGVPLPTQGASLAIMNLPLQAAQPAGASRVLPLRPVWTGLVPGALLYSILLWLVVRLPIILRAILRRTAWRCPACAYPVGVAPVCTECGRQLVPSGRLAFFAWQATLATSGRRRRTRYALGVLGALAVGAAVNVAVAWGCAIGSPVGPEGWPLRPPSAPSSADLRWWRATAPPPVSPRPPSRRDDLALGPGKVCTRLWQWQFVPQGPAAALRMRAGWPMPSMEHSRWLPDVGTEGEMTFRDGLMVPDFLPGAKSAVVPVRPVLSGTLVNTLFYALPVSLIGVAARALRRSRPAPRAGGVSGHGTAGMIGAELP